MASNYDVHSPPVFGTKRFQEIVSNKLRAYEKY
jgi:hypothetical protein